MASGFNLISWKWIAYSVLGQIASAYYLSCEAVGDTALVKQSGKKSEIVSFIMCLVICFIHSKCLEHFWLDVRHLLPLTIDCCHWYSGRALVNSIWELFLLLLKETFSGPTVLETMRKQSAEIKTKRMWASYNTEFINVFHSVTDNDIYVYYMYVFKCVHIVLKECYVF